MTPGDPDEPDLHPGDSNEAVQRLQTRLQALGLFAGALDGYFGDDTATAVVQLQEHAGLPAAGPVDAAVWAAVAAAEQAAGRWPQPAADPHWHWDGESWQHTPEPDAAIAPAGSEPHVDASGQWVWDGDQWQPVGG